MPTTYQQVLDEIAKTAAKTATANMPMWQILTFVVLPVVAATIFILVFMLLIKKKSKESVILYFQGEDIVRIERPIIEAKTFKIGKTTYKIDKLKPLHFQDGIWGTKPFYMLKDDIPIGLQLDDDDKKIKISSETFTDAIENQTLKEFLTMKTSKEGIIMGIAIGVVVGVVLTIIAYATKVLKP